MHLLLTDRLTCPRCLAGAGLILLADQVEGRRVLAGQLGCPNCREKYPVQHGAADFAKTAAQPEGAPEPAEASLLAALMGVTEGPAMVLMLGSFDGAADAIAAMIPEVEVIVARGELEDPQDKSGVSMLRIGDRLPLYDRSMRGVVVASNSMQLAAEAARVCALAARVVLLGAAADVRDALASWGLSVLSESEDIIVAVRVQ